MTLPENLTTLRDEILNLADVANEPPVRQPDRGDPATRLQRRIEGRDWPSKAATMVGQLRLTDLGNLLMGCVQDNIPGDVVETGVWRGGAMIFARAVLNTIAPDEDRLVWLCDSFEGLPPPDPKWPKDATARYHLQEIFRVGLPEVKANFKRFGVSTEGARFLQGWFEDTLPGPLLGRPIAVLRLDGDMYGSTMHVLRSLYDQVSPGGHIIIDDWTACKHTQWAVKDFWKERGLTPDIKMVDWTCLRWQK